MNESTSFKMGDSDDAVEVNAWGRPVDEEVIFDDQHGDNYDQMTVDKLKDQLKARKEAGRDIDTSGITKKSQLIQALRDDDAAVVAEAAGDEDDEDADDE